MANFSKLLKKPKIEPHVTINGVEVNVNSLPDKSVTLEKYKTVRVNTPGFEALIPKLNNEALEYVARHNLTNCREENLATYDYNLKNHLVPELLNRIQELEKEVASLKTTIGSMSIQLIKE